MGEAILARASSGGESKQFEYDGTGQAVSGSSSLTTVRFSRSLADVKMFVMCVGSPNYYATGCVFDAKGNRVYTFGSNSYDMILTITGDKTVGAALNAGMAGSVFTSILAIF